MLINLLIYAELAFEPTDLKRTSFVNIVSTYTPPGFPALDFCVVWKLQNRSQVIFWCDWCFRPYWRIFHLCDGSQRYGWRKPTTIRRLLTDLRLGSEKESTVYILASFIRMQHTTCSFNITETWRLLLWARFRTVKIVFYIVSSFLARPC